MNKNEMNNMNASTNGSNALALEIPSFMMETKNVNNCASNADVKLVGNLGDYRDVQTKLYDAAVARRKAKIRNQIVLTLMTIAIFSLAVATLFMIGKIEHPGISDQSRFFTSVFQTSFAFFTIKAVQKGVKSNKSKR